MADGRIQKLGAVVYPVEDLPGAVAFYRDVVGLTLKFQDGERYAVLEGPGGQLALAARSEDLTAGRPALSLKVDDVEAAIRALTAGGARVVRPPASGPHEVRAVLEDPAGQPLILYAPRG